MSEAGSNSDIPAPAPAGDDELTRAAAAGPPMAWDDEYADAGDGRPEDKPNDLLFNIFREPEEVRGARDE